MTVTPEFVALVVVGIIVGLDRFGLLDRFKRRTAVDSVGELAIADRKIRRLESQVAEMRAQKVELVEGALRPVLEQLGENARLQAQVLDRLVYHNGSFRHMERALGEIHEGLKMLTGFIAGIAELPTSSPPRPRPETL